MTAGNMAPTLEDHRGKAGAPYPTPPFSPPGTVVVARLGHAAPPQHAAESTARRRRVPPGPGGTGPMGPEGRFL